MSSHWLESYFITHPIFGSKRVSVIVRLELTSQRSTYILDICSTFSPTPTPRVCQELQSTEITFPTTAVEQSSCLTDHYDTGEKNHLRKELNKTRASERNYRGDLRKADCNLITWNLAKHSIPLKKKRKHSAFNRTIGVLKFQCVYHMTSIRPSNLATADQKIDSEQQPQKTLSYYFSNIHCSHASGVPYLFPFSIVLEPRVQPMLSKI